MSELTLLNFPCRYPIKVMVRADPGLRAQLDAIVVRHTGPLAPGDVSLRPSARENYTGITYFIEARDEAQIAALFVELKNTAGVLMVL